MSEIVSAAIPAQKSGLPWGHWGRQVLSVLRLELKKGFRRPFGLYLLAAAPVLIALLRLIISQGEEVVDDPTDMAEATLIFAAMYQGFVLRIVVFLACVAIFGNLIRREMLDRSLHYYFLSPIRRELLVVGKYLTGLLVSVTLFTATTVATFFLSYAPYDSMAVRQYFSSGPGLGHLASYILVTVLACVGYGAVFTAFGFFFKSPAIPALAVFGWEGILFLLPPLLKKASVFYYLQSLCPVPMPEGPLALLADAPSPWLAVPGLLLFSALLVGLSAFRIRGMEVKYEEE